MSGGDRLAGSETDPRRVAGHVALMALTYRDLLRAKRRPQPPWLPAVIALFSAWAHGGSTPAPSLDPATAPAVPRYALTVAETAAALGVSESTIKRLLKAGDLADVPIGRARRVRPEAIEAYLDRCEEPSSWVRKGPEGSLPADPSVTVIGRAR